MPRQSGFAALKVLKAIAAGAEYGFERQHDVSLRVDLGQGLQEQDVGSAAGGRVPEAGVFLPQMFENRPTHGRFQHGREAWRHSTRVVDEVADEHDDARNRQARVEQGHVGLQALEKEACVSAR